MDLQGPEIRTSYLINHDTGQRVDKVVVKTGDLISIYGTDKLSESSFVGYRVEGQGVRLGVDLADVVSGMSEAVSGVIDEIMGAWVGVGGVTSVSVHISRLVSGC